VTIKVQKSPRSFDKSALLHDRGIASTSIPMRLDTGDIVLFDNSHILAYGTKFFTMSHVRSLRPLPSPLPFCLRPRARLIELAWR
jgi:hypothetical protein